jgi:hypothetical protein
MAFRLSTGLRNALLDEKAEALNLMTATTISFEDGTGTSGRDQILDSGDGLGDFIVGDKITVAGSTSNNVTAEILGVTAAAIEVAAGTLATEDAGDPVVLASARGGSFSDLFRQGVMRIYSGTQPATADAAETGTLLCTISQSSAAFTKDVFANGLRLGAVASGVLAKEAGDVWSGVGVAAGTAGWFRFYDNSLTTGESTSAIRFDGAVATSGSQCNMANTAVTVGGTSTVDTVALTLPAA